MPNKKYQIIYADPPWRYDFSATHSRDIENQYPTMELSEICNLSIQKIAEKNSVLFLWATAPKLLEALEVMKSWGFSYRTHFIWDKKIIGCGWWNRGRHELLLVGVLGKFSPPKNSDRVESVLIEKRGRHSEKPDFVKQLISEWYPKENKIELFARQNKINLFQKNNWDIWGNEAEGSNKIDL